MKIAMLLFSLLLPGYLLSPAQQLTWTAFEELEEKIRENPKPLLIFIRTDWCKYCAMQEHITFRDSEIVAYLNEHYYCLDLNGEMKEEINFLNRSYGYTSTGAGTGQHELAAFLGKKEGVLSYPTTVILSKNFEIIARESGFLDKDRLIANLRKLKIEN